MKNFLKNPWTIGIGTAILSVILMRILDKIADTKLLFGLWTIIKKIILFFDKKYVVSLWFLILISFSAFLIVVLYFYLKSLFSNEKENINDPFFLNYTSDNFDGVLYKWRYFKNYDKYSSTDYMAYCPKDNCILLHNRCSICGTYFTNIHDNSKLAVLIGHKIENNLFQK
ncbi:hypothetical protein [Flavobacterium sp.]|uniref:hypothetical protein n=1 Tax=Flavobacterium sp. TaxID=239 RepID=UPI0031DD3CC6